jgi:hypothetical protein
MGDKQAKQLFVRQACPPGRSGFFLDTLISGGEDCPSVRPNRFCLCNLFAWNAVLPDDSRADWLSVPCEKAERRVSSNAEGGVFYVCGRMSFQKDQQLLSGKKKRLASCHLVQPRFSCQHRLVVAVPMATLCFLPSVITTITIPVHSITCFADEFPPNMSSIRLALTSCLIFIHLPDWIW